MPSNSHAVDPNAPLPPHLDPRGRHRGNRTKRDNGNTRAGAARIALSLGSLVSIALLVLAGYTFYTFRGINNGIHRFNIVGSDPNAHGPVANGAKFNGKDQNILLVGNDDRTNMTASERHTLHTSADGGSMNTDTMMILHIPADGKKATIISLPRDSYVHIDGHGMDRLNSAYPFGYDSVSSGSVDNHRQAGAQLLLRTVEQLTGLGINHYIQVSLLGFYEISDAIGGVPITLCKAVDDTTAANHAAGLSGGSGLKLSKGKHIIQGVTALEFVRQRHFLMRGDLDRVRRQQYFLTSAFRQVTGPAILTKLQGLGDAVKRNIYLDGSLNLIDLARQMEALSANNITGKTIPIANPNYQTSNGSAVLQVDPAQVQAFVAKVLNPPAATATSTSPAPTSRSSAAPKSGHAPTSASASSPKAIDSKCID